MRVRALGAAAAACVFGLATAQSGWAATACGGETIGAARVAEIIDGRTFRLADGRTVRLAGIEVPAMPRPGAPAAKKGGAAARTALAGLIAGRSVVLRRLGAASDRYGRLVAVAFVRHDGREQSVQRELIAAGFARVGSRVGAKACAADLLAAERAARAAKLGLWADPYYGTKRAEAPAEIRAARGRFALVEGKVLSVRTSGGTIYVNFGRRWSRDFTVTISRRNKRAFTAAGVDPNKLSGRRIRVRGFIEVRGGPRIYAARAEQIEIIGAR